MNKTINIRLKKYKKRLIFFAALNILFFTMPVMSQEAIPETSEAINEESVINQSQEVEMKNGSLYSTLKQGGILMIPLVLLGIFGLTIIIERTIFFIRTGAANKNNLIKHLEETAEKSLSKYREELEDELRLASQVYFNKIEKGLVLLNGIGNIAPLLGFLGTVVGMISAFAAIAAASTVNAKIVAVGIQIALVTTAGGLSVAVPVLGAFHFFNHILQKSIAQSDEIIMKLASKAKRFSEDI
ncbi:MAG: MotA/TolQ/ExbB proton channel family protein [Spirochaetia bacterium]|nr:MotA/TolQ/ExbB proton channel family protein [Spirochaetia bacterium]